MFSKFIQVFLSFVVFASSAALAENPAYRIEVKIKDFKGDVCYLGYPYGDKKYLADTAEINSQGSFVFEGNKALDGGLYFIYNPNNLYFDLIVAEPYFTLETDTLDYINHMKVEGSKENQIFFDFQRFMREKQKAAGELTEKQKNAATEVEKEALTAQLNELDTEVKAYRSNIFEEYPETFTATFIKSTIPIEVPESPKDENGKETDPNFAYKYYKEHFFDNIDFSDSKMLRTPNFYAKIEEYMEKLTVKHPDSVIESAHVVIDKCEGNDEVFRYCVVNLTYKYETSNIMGMDKVFVDLSENYYLTGKAFWADSALTAKIQDRVERIKPNLIGNPAPKLVLLDTLLKPVSLNSIQSDYIVLYFYDPDCGHCKKKTPVLRDLYNDKLKTMGVKVVAVDIKTETDKWKKYIKEQKLNWINLSDPEVRSNFRYEYNIETTPQIYILDDRKKIIAKKLDVEQIEEFINKQIEFKSKASQPG
jgi:peroxiredoxin